jgi:cell division protein FtsB
MTIQAWNIVLNAVVAVLIIGYGIWLRNIVTQQLKSKDAAIGALDAVIKVKEAEISALKSDTAPAIAK